MAALLAVSNLFFFYNTAYFDAPAQTQALLHTWSLGVEEQFYLIWPALLLTASKFGGKSRRAWIALLAVIALASFAGSLWEVAHDPKSAFYMPYTRAWELAIGGLLSFLQPLRSRAMEVLPPLGLAAIGWSAITLTAEQPFPGFNALAPTIGAALVIYPRHTHAGRLLGWLAPLGRISYSLYLWHWPIIVFWRTYNNGEAVGPTAACLIITASIGLSFLSWRYIEQPARRIRIRGALPIALSGNLAAIAAVLPIVLADGLPSRVPEAPRAVADLQQTWAWKCPEMLDIGLPGYPSTSPPSPTCIGGAPWKSARHHAVIWGDSIAEAMLPLFDVIARRHDTSIALVGPCPAIIHNGVARRYLPERPAYNNFCEASRSATLDLLHDRTPIDLVILTASWDYLPGVLVLADSDVRLSDTGFQLMENGFNDLLPHLSAPGRRVLVLGQVPNWNIGFLPGPCAFADVSLPRRSCGVEKPYFTNIFISTPVHNILQAAAERANDTVRLPEKDLCVPGKCLAFVNDEFIYRDGVHLRRDLSEPTKEKLIDLLHLEALFEFPAQTAAPYAQTQ